jgi:hypothetical protein
VKARGQGRPRAGAWHECAVPRCQFGIHLNRRHARRISTYTPELTLTTFASTLLTALLATGDAGVTGLAMPDAARSQGAASNEAATTATPAMEAAPPEPRLPAVAFALDRKPHARRTQAWTRPRRDFSPHWERAHPGVHFSRFLDLARPGLHPPKVPDLGEREWRVALFRFANAVISDLRDAIAAACPVGRCAPILDEASRRLAAFQQAGPRAFTQIQDSASQAESNAWYGWRLGGGPTILDLGCHDAPDLPEVTCRLDLELDRGQVLSYTPRNSPTARGPDLAICVRNDPPSQGLGEIQFDRTYAGAPVVIIGGSARAPQKESPP